MGAHELKALLNYNEIETRLTNIHYSFFFRLQNVSKSLDLKILLIKVIKELKRKNQKKITFFS